MNLPCRFVRHKEWLLVSYNVGTLCIKFGGKFVRG